MIVNPNILPSGTYSKFVIVASYATVLAMLIPGEIIDATSYFFGDRTVYAEHKLAAVLILWLVALAFYFLHPNYCEFAFALGRSEVPQSALNIVGALSERMNLKMPTILCDSDIGNSDAIAYGLPGRRKIFIGRRLLVVAAKNADGYRARMAHELSHIKNRDIDIAYLEYGLVLSLIAIEASAVLYVLLILGVGISEAFGLCRLLDGVTSLWRSDYALSSHLAAAAQTVMVLIATRAAALAVIWMLHASFVRAREIFADAEAVRNSSRSAVVGALGAGAKAVPAFKKWTFFIRLNDMMRYHPSRELRAYCVQHPEGAATPTIAELFILGWVMSQFINSTDELLSGFSRFDEFGSLMLSIYFSGVSLETVQESFDSEFVVAGSLLMVMSLAVIALLASLQLVHIRVIIESVLLARGGLDRARSIFLPPIVISFGFVVGDAIDLTDVHSLFLGTLSVENLTIRMRYLLFALAIGIFMAAVGFVVFISSFFLLCGSRSVPPSELTWAIFANLLVILSYQVIQIAFYGFLGKVAIAALLKPWLYTAAGVTLLACLIIMHFIRDGFHLPSRLRSGYSPWLTS